MNEKEIGVDKTLYEQQESKLSEQSAAFIELLTKRGILEDARIDDDRVRQAKKEKKKNMYHNTFLLLQHYRSILWTLECFPANVAEELDRPLQDLDTLLDRLDLELGLNNRKLESRMESIRRSRLLVDRLNEAVSILKTKPVNGHKMYDIIYMTFLGPDKLTHEELLYRLDISSRHYPQMIPPSLQSRMTWQLMRTISPRVQRIRNPGTIQLAEFLLCILFSSAADFSLHWVPCLPCAL